MSPEKCRTRACRRVAVSILSAVHLRDEASLPCPQKLGSLASLVPVSRHGRSSSGSWAGRVTANGPPLAVAISCQCSETACQCATIKPLAGHHDHDQPSSLAVQLQVEVQLELESSPCPGQCQTATGSPTCTQAQAGKLSGLQVAVRHTTTSSTSSTSSY